MKGKMNNNQRIQLCQLQRTFSIPDMLDVRLSVNNRYSESCCTASLHNIFLLLHLLFHKTLIPAKNQGWLTDKDVSMLKKCSGLFELNVTFFG